MAESMALGDACVAVVDCEHKTAPQDDSGVAWAVGTPAMADGRIDYAQAKRISAETYEAWTRRMVPAEGDLILAREAPVGPVVRVPSRPRVALGQRTVLLRPDTTKVDAGFLYYLLRSDVMQFRMLSQAEGSTVAHLNVADVRDLPLPPLPPLPEQRAIAEVLGALDDKIESNRRIWKLRLELAGSAFRRAAKEAETTTPLGELYEVGLSGVWGQDEPGGKATVATSCLRGRDLEDFVAGGVVESPVRFISEKQLSSRVFQNGEIWTAGSGSLGPSLLITEGVARLWENQLTYSNFVKRLVPIGGHDMAEVAWNAVVDTWRNDGFAAFRTGTAMPNLDPSALLAGVQVPVVANESREEIALLTNAALDPQVLMENLALARLRDTLLPALLSGRIRVPAAADLVDA